MPTEDKLQKTLRIAGIDEDEWNKLTPDQRHTSFKAKIRAAQIKYHPDRVKIDHPDITEKEREEYEVNIRLLNDLDYNLSTSDLEHSSGHSSRPQPTNPEEFFHEFKTSVEASIGHGKRFEDWQKAYEHYFEPNKPRFRGYRHKIEKTSPDYKEEFDKALVKGIYKEFIIPGERGESGAGADFLPPAFRDEEALLIKICGHQRHTDDEVPIISVASDRLKSKESFWRNAIAANPKAVLGLDLLARTTDIDEMESLLHEKEGPVIEPLSKKLLNDAVLMTSVIQRYPSFIGGIGDFLADDEDLLTYAVAQEPLITLSRASERLRNISSSLVEKALLADIYAIKYVSVDISDSEQMGRYREWVEKAWKDLRQNAEDSIMNPPKSRKHLITLLQNPFKKQAQELYDTTEKLIQEVKTFIGKMRDNNADQSVPGSMGIYNFFAYTLPKKATPEEQLNAATALLSHLENKPLRGLAAYRYGMERNNISSDSFDILDKTALKKSLDEWKQSVKTIFKDEDKESYLVPRK